MSLALQTCANCGRKIGALEEAGTFKGQTVCPECYERLAKQKTVAPPSGPTVAAPVAQQTEHVVFQTRHHPIIFIKTGIVSVCLVILFGILAYSTSVSAYVWLVPAVIVAIMWLRATVIYYSSHFVVTTKRVTIKVGFLSRRSFEVLINKVESIQVQQGLMERMYGGGSLVISGTGGSKEVFSNINNPVRFQRSVQDAAAAYGGLTGERG